MKNIFCFVLISIFMLSEAEGFAQKADSIHFRKNAVNVELLGNAAYYSFNYERKILGNKNNFMTIRAGISVYPFRLDGGFAFPLLINGVFGEGNNHFEVGIGKTLPISFSPNIEFVNDNPNVTANLMYRYQNPKGKLIFRIGWTPIIFYKAFTPFDFVNNADLRGALFELINCGVSIGFAF